MAFKVRKKASALQECMVELMLGLRGVERSRASQFQRRGEGCCDGANLERVDRQPAGLHAAESS